MTISAQFYADRAAALWDVPDPADPDGPQKRVLALDLHNKAKSFAIINKTAFLLSVALAIIVVIWPSVVALMSGASQPFLSVQVSAIVQTSVTGLGALAFAVYFQYKKRQTAMENLLRRLVLDPTFKLDLMIDLMTSELSQQDAGFSFQPLAGNKGQTPD